jgi:hypothetical protein
VFGDVLSCFDVALSIADENSGEATSVSVGKVSENESHDYGRVFEPATFDFAHNASEAVAIYNIVSTFTEYFVYRVTACFPEMWLTEISVRRFQFKMNPSFKGDL